MSSTPDSFLLNRLRAQLEFYFSPQNLSRDVYLRNLLSSYGFNAVPLSIIANFPKVRSICNGQIDLALLMRAVEGSGIVTVTHDAVWISPLLPIPPLDASKQQRPTQGAPQQQQQVGVTMKVGEAGDGSMPPSASSSQNSLTAIGNGYVNENGGYPANNVNTAIPAIQTTDTSMTNQSLHSPGHNSLPDATQAQLPLQPPQLNAAAPPQHQQPQPQPTHSSTMPYPAAPIAHPSHGATTYAYPQYTTYRYPLGSAGGPTYHHHPPGGYSAYPSHVVPYQLYSYPPYVQSGGGRGYFNGGRGSGGGGGGGGGGPMGIRQNGEAENGGIRRGSTSGGGKGSADGTKKGKGKLKKGSGIQNYHNQNHGADLAGNTNNQSYGGSTPQQHQPQRWKNDRGDAGSSKDGNDTYGKHTSRNNNHHPRGVGKYDNAGWDRTNRGNNRSQNDAPSSTDGEERIAPSDTYYAESTNPLVRGSGNGPLHAKAGGGRKKKGKRRDGDTERRKDSISTPAAEEHKREIFDANSFPALSPSKNDSPGVGGGPSQSRNPAGSDRIATKTLDLGPTSIHPMSGYADALKQTTKASRNTLIVEPQILATSVLVGPDLSDSAMPQVATTTAAVVIPPPVEMTTTTFKVLEDTFADMKIISTSMDEPAQPQEPHFAAESHTTTIAVGALTGMPTTEVESKTATTSLETTISESSPASVSPTDVAPDARQSKHTEPTPREASHSGTKPSDQDAPPALMEEIGGTIAVDERVVDSSTPSSPPLAWGSKRSWIDVARKQS